MEQGIVWALLENEDWREMKNREGITVEKMNFTEDGQRSLFCARGGRWDL